MGDSVESSTRKHNRHLHPAELTAEAWMLGGKSETLNNKLFWGFWAAKAGWLVGGKFKEWIPSWSLEGRTGRGAAWKPSLQRGRRLCPVYHTWQQRRILGVWRLYLCFWQASGSEISSSETSQEAGRRASPATAISYSFFSISVAEKKKFIFLGMCVTKPCRLFQTRSRRIHTRGKPS